MWLGLALGGMASLFLALSYTFSGMSVRRCKDVGTFGLLCRAHVVMGVLSLIGLPFVWTRTLATHFGDYSLIMLLAIVFYLAGQFCLFMAQRTVDASRVVPLLGMKLLVLAVLNILIMPHLMGTKPESYGIFQWLGIFLTVGAAFILNKAGQRIPWQSLCWVGMTCLGYASSDTCITMLVRRLQAVGEATADPALAGLAKPSVAAAFITYVICGVAGVVLLPLVKKPEGAHRKTVWGWISPFAFCWLTAMLFLYACFARIGTVNGNIVQSTRGIIAILIGAVLAKLGFTELEEKVGVSVLVRRLIAGVMMFLAIVAFNWK
jgi:drug/metabolite transporter (DMT)-like permease